MKRLFLTSSIQPTIADISQKIGAQNKKLVLIGTATEPKTDSLVLIEADRQALSAVGFDVFEYTITGKTANQIKSDLSRYDVLYFSGGNYLYLLHQIQITKSATVIKDLVINQEKIYVGISSGAMIAGPDLSSAYLPELETEAGVKLTDFTALGFINYTIFPHWGNSDYKHNYFDYQLSHAFPKGEKTILLTDNQYIQVEGDMSRIIEISISK